MISLPAEINSLLNSLFIAILSFVLIYLTGKIKAYSHELMTKLKATTQWDTVMDIARMAVRAAQQAHLNGWIESTGEAAKAEAVRVAQLWLNTHGLTGVDAGALAAMIEAAYNEIKAEIEADATKVGQTN